MAGKETKKERETFLKKLIYARFVMRARRIEIPHGRMALGCYVCCAYCLMKCIEKTRCMERDDDVVDIILSH